MITNKQLLGAILCLTIGTISAQDKAADKRDQLVFGIKAGINVSNVWDEQGSDFVADP